MDMSSPAHRQDDDDIDIDIDFTYNDDTLVVDDQMLDDEQTRPNTANDTAMDDDQDDTLVQEADMTDHPDLEVLDEPVVDAPAEEDDELIDYGEDEYLADEHIQEADSGESNVTPVVGNEQQRPNGIVQQISHEHEHGHQPGDIDTASQSAIVKIDETQDDATFATQIPRESSYRETSTVTDMAQGNDHAVGIQDVDQKNTIKQTDDSHQDEPEEPTAQAEEEDVSSDVAAKSDKLQATFVDTSVRRASDVPATPTDTGLHHMVLQFEGLEMPLFRSRQMPEGLLTNDNLVGHHLADLISSCKMRLQESEHADFSDDQECILQFQGLPLELRESSKAAYRCTLNDVLSVYLLLHQNAGTDPVPPLFLTITAPENFADVLDSLKVAAESGQGIPNVQYSEEGNEDESYFEENGGERELVEDAQGDPSTAQYLDDSEFDTNADEVEGTYTEGDSNDYSGEYEAEEYDGEDDLQQQETEQQERLGDSLDRETIALLEPEALAPATISNLIASVDSPNDRDGSIRSKTSDQNKDVLSANDKDEETVIPSSSSSATAQVDRDDNITGEYEADSGNWHGDESLICESSDITDNLTDTLATETELAKNEDDHISGTDRIQIAAAKTTSENGLANKFPDGLEQLENDETDAGADNETDNDAENDEFQNNRTEPPDQSLDGDQSVVEDEQPHDASDLLDDQPDQPGSGHEYSEQEYVDEDHSQAEKGTPTATKSYGDPNETIDFDDDTPAEHEARKGSPSATGALSSDSPLGKRSFEEHADDELYDDDEPELKKARSG
nr:hypothetical protein CFP56_31013 [Quercus suber]